MKPEATGRVRIVKVPSGEAPEHIRQGWVGLVLPCYPTLGYIHPGGEVGVLSREPVQGQCGVSVPQQEAINILHARVPRTALWWIERGFPHEGECFGFGEDEIELVSGVVRQNLVHVPDEAMGNINR